MYPQHKTVTLVRVANQNAWSIGPDNHKYSQHDNQKPQSAQSLYELHCKSHQPEFKFLISKAQLGAVGQSGLHVAVNHTAIDEGVVG